MIKYQKYGYIVILLFVLFISTTANAALIEPYVILQAEHGDLIGENLFTQENSELSYVSVVQGSQNDLISLLLDVFDEKRYEFWIYLSGIGSGDFTIYGSDQEIFRDNFHGQSSDWHWIKLSTTCSLSINDYYVVLSDFTGFLNIDKIIVKTIDADSEIIDIESQGSSSSEPILQNESPWITTGLSPYSSLLQNGNEYVSTTSGILTIAATDLVIPGRDGLDLVISRYYNSKTDKGDRAKHPNLYDRWNFGFPYIYSDVIYFPDGSAFNMKDDEVEVRVENVGKDKKLIYINSKNSHFKFVKYKKYIGSILWFPQYKTDHYELYLSDGTYCYFNDQGDIQYIQGKNPNNKIKFYYDNYKISQIVDTVGRVYNIEYFSDKIDITRQQDGKRLVSYGIEDGKLRTVKDSMDRVTSYFYEDYAGITKIVYPSGKISEYTYFTKPVSGVYSNGKLWYSEHYWVENQKIYTVAKIGNETLLVSKTVFKYSVKSSIER
ncbi:MAG: hypothetical protein KAX49_17175, partial [Halanaerobiales bacterium]|nr:hypothetical protein [Halanaerobiales bacterium]